MRPLFIYSLEFSATRPIAKPPLADLGTSALTHALPTCGAVDVSTSALSTSTSGPSSKQLSNISTENHHTIKSLVSIGFKSSLKALKKTSKIVPPLGAAVDLLVDAADLVPVCFYIYLAWVMFDNNTGYQQVEKRI